MKYCWSAGTVQAVHGAECQHREDHYRPVRRPAGRSPQDPHPISEVHGLDSREQPAHSHARGEGLFVLAVPSKISLYFRGKPCSLISGGSLTWQSSASTTWTVRHGSLSRPRANPGRTTPRGRRRRSGRGRSGGPRPGETRSPARGPRRLSRRRRRTRNQTSSAHSLTA